MLEVRDLHASIDGKIILKGLNLTVKPGEVHAIMGPNGAGKSTLSRVLVGDPRYKVESGSATWNGQDLFAMEPEGRAAAGLFLGFQYPVEVPGVSNVYFLRTALNALRKARGEEEIKPAAFLKQLKTAMEFLEMDKTFRDRPVNVGFSGGEKKRNEILQLLVLQPTLALLDETDSGLDIDALRIVAKGVNSTRGADKAIVLVTHYQRLLDEITPDFVHVLADGQIVRSGDADLARELERDGYANVREAIA